MSDNFSRLFDQKFKSSASNCDAPAKATFEADAPLHIRLAAIRDAGLIAHMTEADTKVMLALVMRAKFQDGTCWPGIPMLEKDTGLSHGAVCAAINRLGALCIDIGKKPVPGRDGRPRKVNLYTIVGPKTTVRPTRVKRPNNFGPSKSVDGATQMDAVHADATDPVHTDGRQLGSSNVEKTVNAQDSGGTMNGGDEAAIRRQSSEDAEIVLGLTSEQRRAYRTEWEAEQTGEMRLLMARLLDTSPSACAGIAAIARRRTASATDRTDGC